MFNYTNKKGYSLVETMVAVTILLLAVAGPLTIAYKGIQSAQFSKNQTIAFLLAQEGNEAVFYLRNQQLIASISGGGGATLADVWNWVDDPNLDPCFINDRVTLAPDGDVGCNLDFTNNDPTANITDCSVAGDCTLWFQDTSNQPRSAYHVYLNTTIFSQISPFTRVLTIEHINDNELEVTSVVSWNATLFGSVESVELVTNIFKLYESTP